MNYKKGFKTLIAATGMALGVIGPGQAATLTGDSQPIGMGTARTYVTLDSTGNPTTLGLAFSAAILSDLPLTETEYNLQFPQQAAPTAFTHMGFDWNPHGHEPPGIYGVPHFDFHFYTISPPARAQITAIGEDLAKVYQAPPAGFVPADYILAPESAIPGQGSHWVDLTAAEYQGDPHGFGETLIYGFYNGEMVFIEPMISKSTLEDQLSFTQDLKLPTLYPQSAYYPTTYSLAYSAAASEYTVALGGLEFRQRTAVPEPSAAGGLLFLGMFGMGSFLQRQRQRQSVLADRATTLKQRQPKI